MAKMKKTQEGPEITQLHFIQHEHDAFNQYLELTNCIVELAEKMLDLNVTKDIKIYTKSRCKVLKNCKP